MAAPEHLQRASRNPREPPSRSKLQEVALGSPHGADPRVSGLPGTAQAPSLAGRTEVEWKARRPSELHSRTFKSTFFRRGGTPGWAS